MLNIFSLVFRRLGFLSKKVGFIRQGIAMVYCCLDAETPFFIKGGMAVVLLYVIFPLDVMPDIVPVLGWLDDLGVLTGMVWALKRFIKAKHWQKADELIFFKPER